MEQLLIFDITNDEAYQGKKITVAEYCNSIMVTNTGTSLVLVNDYPLHPSANPNNSNGEAMIIGGNRGEIYKGRLDLKFADNNGRVMVTQKFYTNVNK